MIRIMKLISLVILFGVPMARAAEIVEYKGAELIRQEDRGVMVFKVKDGEIKATPVPSMKGYDLAGKEYLNNFDAAEKKQTAYMLLKVGNVMDLKINQVNAKTAYIAEARLTKGEPLAPGEKNQVVKPDAKKKETRPEDGKPSTESADANKAADSKPSEKKPPKPKDEKHSYSKAVIKKYDGKRVTFEVQGEEITAEVPGNFKAIDRTGRLLKKDDRYRVFKEDNEATISTTKSPKKEVLTDIKLTKGALADK
jgi:hypothetical protein